MIIPSNLIMKPFTPFHDATGESVKGETSLSGVSAGPRGDRLARAYQLAVQ